MLKSLFVIIVLICAAAAPTHHAPRTLAGDFDVYIALSATPKFGFEWWRRMGFAHFAGADSGNVGYLMRRTGQPMLTANQVATSGDSVILTQDARVVMRAAWHGDTLAGLQYVDGKVMDRRFRLVRRSTPGAVERDYQVWNRSEENTSELQ